MIYTRAAISLKTPLYAFIHSSLAMVIRAPSGRDNGTIYRRRKQSASLPEAGNNASSWARSSYVVVRSTYHAELKNKSGFDWQVILYRIFPTTAVFKS